MKTCIDYNTSLDRQLNFLPWFTTDFLSIKSLGTAIDIPNLLRSTILTIASIHAARQSLHLLGNSPIKSLGYSDNQSKHALDLHPIAPCHGKQMRYPYRCISLSIALYAVLLTNSLPANESVKSPFQHIKYSDAWKSSRKTGRPMLLFVTSLNCRFCHKMEQESYHKPEITNTIHKTFEAVTIKQSVSPDLVRKLGVRIFPTTFIVAPNGKIVDRIEGFIGPTKLATHLEPSTRTAQASHQQPAPIDTEQRK